MFRVQQTIDRIRDCRRLYSNASSIILQTAMHKLFRSGTRLVHVTVRLTHLAEGAERSAVIQQWAAFSVAKLAILQDFRLDIRRNVSSFSFLGKQVTLSDSILNGDLYDTYVREIYRVVEPKDRSVLDVGANIGDSSVYFALKGAERVLALEPHPLSFQSLAENVRINSLQSVITPVNAGLSSRVGTASFDASSNSGVVARLGSPCRKEQVSVLSLARVIEDFDLEDSVLKLDCEGCEYEAILSAEPAILRHFERIVIEFHHGGTTLRDKLMLAGFEVLFIASSLDSRPAFPSQHDWTGLILARRR